MDALIGIKGKNFTLIASDTNIGKSILLYKNTADKFYTINNTVLAYSGDQGEAFRLCSFAVESATFECLKYEMESTPEIVSTILQNEIHESLRKKQIGVGCLVGGRMRGEYELYMVDMYGAMCRDNYFCLGYASYFGYGILDKEYKAEITVDEAIGIVEKIAKCLKNKFLVRYDSFMVKIVDEAGVREVVVDSNK